jgi:cell division protease FtsH
LWGSFGDDVGNRTQRAPNREEVRVSGSTSSPQKTPTSGNKPTAPGGEPRAGGISVPRWLWAAIFLGLLVWNVFLFFAPTSVPSVEIPYSTFLAQVQADNVAQVTLTDQAVKGTFRAAIADPSIVASPAPAASSDAPSAPVTYLNFTSTLPPIDDPVLLPLLETNKVEINAKETGGGSLLGSLLVNVLPLVLLIGFLAYQGRRVQQSQAGIFGFGGSKARVYDAERPKVTFADVAGQDEAKKELIEIVDFLKNPEKYRSLGARLPRGVLLVGPPGTGKTLMARAVAGEADVPFFSISASEFVELFVGVGASRVRDLFAKAKAAAPSIVFVDEIDAVGRQRGAGLGGGNDEREQTLNQLLVEMDGFDDQTSVIVLGATNRPDVLDPALLRPGRFDRQVTVAFPDRAGREAILRIHTRNIPVAESVDLGLIARSTPGFSGADLANLANEAALRAARKNQTAVTQADFEEALDSILLGTRQPGLTNVDERRLVAYHEGGHAIVARLTPGADPVHRVTIVPHGQALGVTEQRPDEDRRNYPRDYLMGRLAVLLGGRAAEDVVFGQPTTGAESDLKAATSLARRMVGLWGMTDEVGPVSFGVGETQPFLGRELAAPKEYAEATAARIDEVVVEIITTARDQATSIILGARPALDALADELIAREMVDSRRLDEILVQAGFTPAPAKETGIHALAGGDPAVEAPAAAATTDSGTTLPGGTTHRRTLGFPWSRAGRRPESDTKADR